jgi:cystathionine beta-synthase
MQENYNMNYFNNVLETIGNTPLIRLNKIVKSVPATVLAKVETFNPGHSIKDRMAMKMLDVAEKEGKIKPGGTIIECTSGNTGMGLALGACVRGYKCIFTTSDKQSKEKLDLLRALGAEVIVCPTNVSADDERSYYSVAEQLSKTIPNSFWFNQYDNLANRLGHYESTGPEIWKQTDGKITHLVVGVGTGGTISGTAKYLKEQNPDIKIWGIDTYGSVFKKYHETGEFDEKEIFPYVTEGIGEDIIPKNVDFSLIDHFEKVTDKDGAVYTRKLAREEGLLMGYSAGSAVKGVLQLQDRLKEDDVVVVIFHDHGSRYVGKVYNDEWMRERGFLDEEITIGQVLERKDKKEWITTSPDVTVDEVLDMMKSKEISQIPVLEDNQIIGTVYENQVLSHLVSRGVSGHKTPVKDIMGPALPEVNHEIKVKDIIRTMDSDNYTVITKDRFGNYNMISQYDILKAV